MGECAFHFYWLTPRLGMTRARLTGVRRRDLGPTKKQLASSSIRCHLRIDNFMLAVNPCAIQPQLHKSGPLQARIIKNKNKLSSED